VKLLGAGHRRDQKLARNLVILLPSLLALVVRTQTLALNAVGIVCLGLWSLSVAVQGADTMEPTTPAVALTLGLVITMAGRTIF
jgi:CHASE2 domain-containing sensor protein